MEPIIKPCIYCEHTKMCIVDTHIYEKLVVFQVKCVDCGAMGPKARSRITAIEKHNEVHNSD